MNSLSGLKEVADSFVKEEDINSLKDYNLISALDLMEQDLPEIEYLVKDLIPRRGVTILGGDSGSFKTFLAMHTSLCLISEKDFLGYKKTLSGSVLYVDEENRANALKMRLRLLTNKIQNLNHHDLNFLISQEIKLDTDIGSAVLEHIVKTLSPELVVLDSFVRFFRGDENSSNDVKKIFDVLKPLIEKYGCSFLILHHTTKNDKSSKAGLRGSGDLSAFCDSVLMIERKGKKYILSQLKSRHQEEHKPIEFEVESDSESLEILFSGVKEEDMNASQRCSQDMILWFSDNQIDDVTGTNILNHMQSKGHSKKSVYDALHMLEDEAIIKKTMRNQYQINQQKIGKNTRN